MIPRIESPDVEVVIDPSVVSGTIVRAMPDWRPIAEAPVPAYKPDGAYNPHWPCLLQTEAGHVSEGWAYWVPPSNRTRGGKTEPILRWATRTGWCTTPKYWMPLPAPLQER